MSKKGSKFERDAAVELSKWWSRKGADDLFWRTHGSGARATSRSKGGKKTRGQYGDICAVDNRGATLLKAFTISLKRGYRDTSIQDIADQLESKKTPSQIEIWIKEAIRDHRLADSIGWLLIQRKDRRRALAFMPLNVVFKFEFNKVRELLNVTPCVFFRLQKKMTKKRMKRLKLTSTGYLKWYLKNNACIFGIRLEDFLRIITRDDVTEMVRRNKDG